MASTSSTSTAKSAPRETETQKGPRSTAQGTSRPDTYRFRDFASI